MSQYTATVTWQRRGQDFLDNRYSRAHDWVFDGGARIAASASPHIVPVPQSVAANVDPEEAFIAALSSCHMLFFLSIAAKRRWIVDHYCDEATGVLETNASGTMAMTRVTLKPEVLFHNATKPDRKALEKTHHQAHELCFIANSVTTQIDIEPRWTQEQEQ